MANPKQLSFVLAVTVVLLLAEATPWAGQNHETVATKSAETWLALVDNKQYEQSWQSAAKVMRNAVPKEQWAAAMGSARGPLGKLVSRRVSSATYRTSLPGVPDGKYVVIQFATSFEQKKEAVETVTPMQEEDGVWRVSGYYIR